MHYFSLIFNKRKEKLYLIQICLVFSLVYFYTHTHTHTHVHSCVRACVRFFFLCHLRWGFLWPKSQASISTFVRYLVSVIIIVDIRLSYILDCWNRLIGLVGRVLANDPRDLGSISGRVIPKTLKMVLDTSLLNTQLYKVRIKGKVEQSRERGSALPYTSV